MEGFTNNDAATLSLVGNGGGLYGDRGNFVGDGSVGVAVAHGNRDAAAQAHNSIAHQIDRNADVGTLIQTLNGFNSVERTLGAQTLVFSDKINTQSAFQQAEFNAIQREMNANAREAAKCCCETQKLITAEATETRALVLAVEGRGTQRDLDSALAEITQLKTIAALSRGNGNSGN